MVWDCVFCRTIYLCSLVAKLWEIKCSLTTVSATDEQSDMSMCDFGGAKVSSWNKETRNSVSQTLKSRGNKFYACGSWTIWELWGISGETIKSHKGEERKSKLILCIVKKFVSYMMIDEVKFCCFYAYYHLLKFWIDWDGERNHPSKRVNYSL